MSAGRDLTNPQPIERPPEKRIVLGPALCKNLHTTILTSEEDCEVNFKVGREDWTGTRLHFTCRASPCFDI